MNFRAALEACPPGLVFKDERNGWTEYTVQFGRNCEGKAYWTAGGTAGGWLDEKEIERYSELPGVYKLYSTHGSSYGLTPGEASRLYTDIKAREVKEAKVHQHDREAFVGKVQEMVRRNSVVPEEADLATLLPTRLNSLALDLIKVIDGTAHPTDPGYELIPRTVSKDGCMSGKQHQNIAGGLEELFLKIQS